MEKAFIFAWVTIAFLISILFTPQGNTIWVYFLTVAILSGILWLFSKG
jgi:hypothetical protein